ncbi:putative tetratricopeptide-like helical domain superfamily [Helianthus annuus]|uniref:Tetratricopeptide-like helical domain superfamily n=1 Tax=Helianthus annuus TaxID=4232 RepID=A0A9K3J8C4_HELAN|nr:putative tetratricopeptide-like helical domain superfamily [Helianthus annuus]KAJ0931419.1 putative tetratricopeptide-like helical domain superfamily [Helianthus annuus]
MLFFSWRFGRFGRSEMIRFLKGSIFSDFGFYFVLFRLGFLWLRDRLTLEERYSMDVYTCKSLSEWMANRKGSKLTAPGAAIHLDLLSKAQGVEQAEQYFNSLPDDVKKLQVYSALFNSYAATKSVEKAEATAEKMKQSRMMTTLSYNFILILYKKIGDYEKLNKIHQSILEMGILCD